MILSPEQQNVHLRKGAQVLAFLALHAVVGLVAETLHVEIKVLQRKSTFLEHPRLNRANDQRAAGGLREEFVGA